MPIPNLNYIDVYESYPKKQKIKNVNNYSQIAGILIEPGYKMNTHKVEIYENVPSFDLIKNSMSYQNFMPIFHKVDANKQINSAKKSQFDFINNHFDQLNISKMSKHFAENLLNQKCLDGEFIVRHSNSQKNCMVLSVMFERKTYHFTITIIVTQQRPQTPPGISGNSKCNKVPTGTSSDSKNRKYCIGNYTFDDLTEIVNYYTRHPLYRIELRHAKNTPNFKHIYLIKPYA
ncbi:unnamed protein product [Gordionus sp. m RMFG-2023]